MNSYDRYDEEREERRIGRECQERNLGSLGQGVNVARVEVQWWKDDPGLGFDTSSNYEGGFYFAAATGDEPECQGEYGTIYNVFHDLVTEAMDAKVASGKIDGYEILDTSAA